MRCHQFEKVIGLRRFGQFAQPDDPVGILLEFLAHQRTQELPFADAGDRGVELVDLRTECLEGAAVHDGCPGVHAQLPVGVGSGEQGLLDGRVGDLALDQDAPGHQGPLVAAARGVGPTGAEQRPVGERSAQANPVEHFLGAGKIFS